MKSLFKAIRDLWCVWKGRRENPVLLWRKRQYRGKLRWLFWAVAVLVHGGLFYWVPAISTPKYLYWLTVFVLLCPILVFFVLRSGPSNDQLEQLQLTLLSKMELALGYLMPVFGLAALEFLFLLVCFLPYFLEQYRLGLYPLRFIFTNGFALLVLAMIPPLAILISGIWWTKLARTSRLLILIFGPLETVAISIAGVYCGNRIDDFIRGSIFMLDQTWIFRSVIYGIFLYLPGFLVFAVIAYTYLGRFVKLSELSLFRQAGEGSSELWAWEKLAHGSTKRVNGDAKLTVATGFLLALTFYIVGNNEYNEDSSDFWWFLSRCHIFGLMVFQLIYLSRIEIKIAQPLCIYGDGKHFSIFQACVIPWLLFFPFFTGSLIMAYASGGIVLTVFYDSIARVFSLIEFCFTPVLATLLYVNSRNKKWLLSTLNSCVAITVAIAATYRFLFDANLELIAMEGLMTALSGIWLLMIVLMIPGQLQKLHERNVAGIQ